MDKEHVKIIYLLTAERIDGLTNYGLDCIDVAVNRKRNITTMPDWPTLKLWYFDASRLEIGLSEIEVRIRR